MITVAKNLENKSIIDRSITNGEVVSLLQGGVLAWFDYRNPIVGEEGVRNISFIPSVGYRTHVSGRHANPSYVDFARFICEFDVWGRSITDFF